MGHMDKFKNKETFLLLCEAGFIAVNQMDEDSARKLFAASELLDPENTLPKIGMGYMYLCKLQLKQAAESFSRVLEINPHDEMAKAFLGLSTSLSPDSITKGEKLLAESASTAKDPSVKKMASSALEFVDKFIKKAPSPMQSQKK